MMLDEIQWGDLWIARDTDTVVQFDHMPSRLVEATPLVGGSNAKMSDRGNTTNQFTIGVLREHASVSAARSFILSHAKTIEQMAQTSARNLRMRYKSFPVTEYSLLRSVVTSYPAKQKGVSTIHTYTFVGENIS